VNSENRYRFSLSDFRGISTNRRQSDGVGDRDPLCRSFGRDRPLLSGGDSLYGVGWRVSDDPYVEIRCDFFYRLARSVIRPEIAS
jgi:hypothetical protein